MKKYTIKDGVIRIAIEVASKETGELIFTRYCDVEDIAHELADIATHKSWKVVKTYYTDEVGRCWG